MTVAALEVSVKHAVSVCVILECCLLCAVVSSAGDVIGSLIGINGGRGIFECFAAVNAEVGINELAAFGVIHVVYMVNAGRLFAGGAVDFL